MDTKKELEQILDYDDNQTDGKSVGYSTWNRGNMTLISSKWGDTNTFKLIPIDNNCPYNEVIYNPDYGVLAIIGKDKKDHHMMIDKLNDNGTPEPNKNQPGTAKQQRVTLEKYYEYYLENEDDIISFVEKFADNFDLEKVKSFLKK